ncbi:uncharacterized protein LOC119556845 [Drosophila subpulchrella]|uniref:uncharacterized protein LOC119556845 n=1 Tax=Drosophila subpulchrella TaxID=1486046 RepID=UPI0018A164F7|nr:uncharacterized protein LOC119556845 [Drosophila subpulchrella]
MLKLIYFSGFLFIIQNLQAISANSQDNGRSVCLLEDPPNQCGDFCLTKLHPMIDLIPVTNSKLERIQSEQQALRAKLLAVQFSVEAQRVTVQNSLKNITTKREFGARLNETERKLRVESSELKNQLQLLRTRIEDQESAIQNKLDALMASLSKTITKDDFQAKLNDMEAQLNRLQSTLSKLEDTKSSPQETHSKPIPPRFQKIGERYFYIENNLNQTWYEAAVTCHRMGGYLAGIKDQQELLAIQAKIKAHVWYWLGINDLMTAGQFLSVASGKPAEILTWRSDSPNNEKRCVQLQNGDMSDWRCNDKVKFICQSDIEI